MLPTTLAMAPHHRFRLTDSDKAHRAAQAATFELIGHVTHNLILSNLVLGELLFDYAGLRAKKA
jgi:hypothetical protein